tara:strand:- start:4 stop:1395 length:1392 start_codon:yes stop_codon:yes gene_type:complete
MSELNPDNQSIFKKLMNYVKNNITDTLIIIFLIILSYKVLIRYIKTGYILGNYSNSLENFENYSNNDLGFIDTTYYLNKKNQPIIIKETQSYIILKSGYINKNTYLEKILKYFKKKIYPNEPIQFSNSIDIIKSLNQESLDMTFLSEELLYNYIMNYNNSNNELPIYCKYLDSYIKNNKMYTNPTEFKGSAIGTAFDQDFYLIVKNTSNIFKLSDILNYKIGIWEDSYYYFYKLYESLYKLEDELPLDDLDHIIDSNFSKLIDLFIGDKLDVLFIVCNNKNDLLINLTKATKIRFIPLHIKSIIRRDKIKLVESKGIIDESTYKYKSDSYYETDKEYRERFNKSFQKCRIKNVDLYNFYELGNERHYLETFSVRMLLVTTNNLKSEIIKDLTKNYIINLQKIKQNLINTYYDVNINNYNDTDFNYQNLLLFDSIIPLHPDSKSTYEKDGLIKYEDIKSSKINI